MRKFNYIIIPALIISLISPLAAYSAQQIYSCPGKPYPVSNSVTRGIQRFLGLNLLATKAVELGIQNQLKNTAKGDFDVKIKTYSAMDLLAGKLKGVEVKAKNINADDIYVSSAEVKSLCDFIYIDYKKNPGVPLVPVLVGFKGAVTEKDLNKTLSSETYKNKLQGLKIKIYGNEATLVDFYNTKADIVNNKISLLSDIHLAGMPESMRVPVKITAGLKLIDNKIRLTDIQMTAKSIATDFGVIGKLIELQKPVLFDLNSLEKNGMRVDLKDLIIKDNQINIQGTAWMAAAKQ